MQHKANILFLTLRVFSATGGIEKVCRVAGKALQQHTNTTQSAFKVFSMYDHSNQVLEQYFSAKHFCGFQEKKLRFTISAIKEGLNNKVVLLSHINLLTIGFIIKLFSPKTQLLLIAHGIEVWRPLSFFKRFMLKRCTLILPVSVYTKNKMIELYGIRPEKLMVLNNCLDPFLPPPVNAPKKPELMQRYGFNANNKIILTLTRISSTEGYKGYDNVIEAVKNLHPRYPNLRHLIIGKYDVAEKARLDLIIEKAGVKDCIRFSGFIPDKSIADHFNLADLYIMPSKKEGFGIVFIEALFYGKPVIAGNKDGSVDALANGRFGVLINPDDQSEITQALENMLSHTDQYIPHHAAVIEQFGFETYQRAFGKLLNQLEA